METGRRGNSSVAENFYSHVDPKFNCLYEKESACNGKADDACFFVISTFYLFQYCTSLNKVHSVPRVCFSSAHQNSNLMGLCSYSGIQEMQRIFGCNTSM